ncbi:MAG: Ig-like domain-containing protein [Prevotellaceae bacterium]|jgi:hypothetical protein|nr:Ig-like domain-containing protein [Prevotellaceae bacterium]
MKKLFYFLAVAATLAACGPKPLELKGISLSSDRLELLQSVAEDEAGEMSTLVATLIPSEISPKPNITWTSSDESVATVDRGVVTAWQPGECIITAKAGEFTATCNVTVLGYYEKLKCTGFVPVDFDTITAIPIKYTKQNGVDTIINGHKLTYYIMFQGLTVDVDWNIQAPGDYGLLIEVEAIAIDMRYLSDNKLAMWPMMADYDSEDRNHNGVIDDDEIFFIPTVYQVSDAFSTDFVTSSNRDHDWLRGVLDLDAYLNRVNQEDQSIEYRTGAQLWFLEKSGENWRMYYDGVVKDGSFTLTGGLRVDDPQYLALPTVAPWTFTVDRPIFDEGTAKPNITAQLYEFTWSSSDWDAPASVRAKKPANNSVYLLNKIKNGQGKPISNLKDFKAVKESIIKQ